MVHFANDKKWLIYSVENQCQTSLDLISDMKIDEQFDHVWMSDSLLLSDEVQKAMYENDLCNGLTLYDKRENYVDLWAFATDKHNNTALDLYINKLTIIKRFVLYLQDKANYIFFPKHMDLCIDTGNKLDFSSFDDTAESLMGIDLFGISKFYIDAEKKQYLTKRELLCLLCL
ncbi:hypothetical protein N9N97_02700, partial [Rickettsiaceae bacterium]|nr:hypothetical protein [Rickettsiaceae bacterium]